MDTTGNPPVTPWQRPSRCKADSPDCVEWRILQNGDTQLRDSKNNGTGPVLVFSKQEMEAYEDAVRRGETRVSGSAIPASLAGATRT